jgi:hypothetical protein
MKEVKPPERYRDPNFESVFLAGSIEMGTAENWQLKVVSELSSKEVVIYNPRRTDWDSSWKQEYENPQFYQQVNWELDSLEIADFILLYLVPDTMSPISLLELGIHAQSKKLYVVCPDGFWRKGNVDIVCGTYDIPLFNSLDAFKKHFTEITAHG